MSQQSHCGAIAQLCFQLLALVNLDAAERIVDQRGSSNTKERLEQNGCDGTQSSADQWKIIHFAHATDADQVNRFQS
jgi:hypothetical protein